jgi:septum formation protein
VRAPELILASASPRRLALLRSAGLSPRVVEPSVPEEPRESEPPEAYVRRVARDKAGAVAARHPTAVIVAADTEVILGARILGKPTDDAHARSLLRELAGREHTVLTAVCILGPRGEEGFCVATRVRIEATPEMIDWYVGTGEPAGKAGAYAIQGAGGALVAEVHGSYASVVGLPLSETLAALARAGVPLAWSDP